MQKETTTLVRFRVLLLALSLGLILYSFSVTGKSYALDTIGIGISKGGQLRAAIGERIEYQLTIVNLGEYRIENITVIDKFPNGTTEVWPIAYLSAQGQPGNSLNISHVSYTVEETDMISADPNFCYVVNHAEVVGYAAVEGLGLLVSAETNFPTFIMITPVGGHTVDVKIIGSQNPTAGQLLLLSLILVLFQTSHSPNKTELEQSIATWRRNRKYVLRA